MSTDTLKFLKLKTGVVQRTTKELHSYKQELEENRAKVEEVRNSDDHSKLKQWENVTQETQSMIPDTAGRLRTALEELQRLLDESSATETSTVEHKVAMEAVTHATSALHEE